ncbi:MAG: lipopolysaccharide biosynthesis protein [Burkholderiales bacterium]|nr:lipopolysaccharide biosynthesis protein [Burkholderiales bacterium]
MARVKSPVTGEPQQSRAHRTILNVAWLGSAQAIRQAVAILATILLARFLGPTEFGIFAMMVFVNELAQLLVDFGMGSALIQRKDIHQRLLSSCFWINLGVGAVAALTLLVLGPWIAAYFEQPLIRWLLLASGVNLLIAAVTVLPQALLSRRLAFRDVALGTLLGSVCGAITAVAMASAGFGVWSLALQPVAGNAATMLLLYARARWLPSFEFDLEGVRGLLVFSGQLLGSNVIGHVTRNLTSLILGPAMGAPALGLITMAQTVTWLPIAQFSQAVVRATFPVFSQMQDDLERFRQAVYRSAGAIGMLAFPMLIGIAVLAGDLMPVVFGPKWRDAAPLVVVLCGFSIVQCVATLAGTSLLAAGRGGLFLATNVVGLPVMATALWLNCDGSVMQAVVALVIASTALQLLTLGAAIHAIRGRWRDYLQPLARPMLCSTLMAAAMLLVAPWLGAQQPAVRLVALGVVGALVYPVLSLVLNRKATMELVGLVFNRRRG